MAVILDGNDLYLTGAVGFDLFDDYFTHSEVMIALLQVGRGADLTIHLNSPGGYTDEASAIANAIQSRPSRTSVVVEGVAMSAATVIACAANEVVMADGTLWMVHEPMITLLSANSDALASGVQAQTLLTDAYAQAYVRRTGRSEAQVREWMKAETYFGADEAVEAGFADRKSAEVVDLVAVAPAWDYGRSYAHAPQRLVAAAKRNDWRLPAASKAAPPATTSRKETTMADKTAADEKTANTETETAAAPEAETETVDGTEQEKERPDQKDPDQKEEPAKPADDDPIKAERQRAADIIAACDIAGQPKAAGEFIAQGKSLSEVVAALQKSRASAPAGTTAAASDEIMARNGGGAQQPPLRVDLAADMRRRTGVAG